LLAGMSLSLAARPARADEAVKAKNSLSFVPADTAFYLAMLRNREQVEAVLNSKAFKRLMSQPLVQMGLKPAMQKFHKPGGPGDHLKNFLSDPDNKELLELLLDAVSNEIFLYGDNAWADLISVLSAANNAQQFAPAIAALSGGDPNKAQFHAMLQAAQQ